MNLLEVALSLVKSEQTSGQSPRRFQGGEAAGKSAQRFLVGIECPKNFPVQLKVIPEPNPVITASLCRFGYGVGRLWPNLNFRLRSPVIFAFRVADQHHSQCVPNLDSVLRLRAGEGQTVVPRKLGYEINSFAEQDPATVQHGNRSLR